MSYMKYIVDTIIHDAINNTNEGNWIVYKKQIEVHFNTVVDMNDLSEELLSRDEVADVQHTDDEIDIIIWGEYLS